MKKLSLLLVFTLTLSTTHAQFSSFSQIQEWILLIEKGEEYNQKKEYSTALEYFEEAIAMYSKSHVLRSGIAEAYLGLNDYDNAIRYGRKSLLLNKKYLKTYTVLSSAYNAKNNSENAVKICKKGIRRFPKNEKLHHNNALALYKQKSYIEAEKAILKTIKINPENMDNHALLGSILLEKGDVAFGIISMYYYLLAEPASETSSVVHSKLISAIKNCIEIDDKQAIIFNLPGIVSIPLNLTSEENMKRYLDSESGAENIELLEIVSSKLFLALYELSDKKGQHDLIWKSYLPVLKSVYEFDAIDEMCYFISQSTYPEIVNEWIEENENAFDRLKIARHSLSNNNGFGKKL